MIICTDKGLDSAKSQQFATVDKCVFSKMVIVVARGKSAFHGVFIFFKRH